MMADFDQRCAYSMVHVKAIAEGQMHVDHFDPSMKRVCGYDNLFPAYAVCNMAKSDTPPPEGMRFLNPCREMDYGEQIFEDPKTHELKGAHAVADWHILMLDLNNPALVHQREERAVLRRLMTTGVMQRPWRYGETAELLEICTLLKGFMERKIPDIPPPPES